MHMATTSRWWTAADLEELPEDGCRYEVLEGELLVTPAPAFEHRAVTGQLVAKLAEYCRAHSIGVVVVPGVVRWNANELQPDVAVATIPVPHSGRSTGDSSILVVEIHSPSTELRDRSVKRAAYMALDIPEYWQVNVQEKSVLVTRLGRGQLLVKSVLTWHPDPNITPLQIDLSALFR
jgi:Uma2 family endonuclease